MKRGKNNMTLYIYDIPYGRMAMKIVNIHVFIGF